MLFILVAEVMALAIRHDKNITGIKIKDEEFKICQLADDTTLFLKDINSLQRSLTLVQNFGKVSGLKLNIDKTEITLLGGLRIDNLQMPVELQKIQIKKGPFQTLGIWFSGNEDQAINLNFKEKIEATEQTLSIWPARNLSWKGKITILKTLIIPKFIYLFASLHTPLHILKKSTL